MDPRFNVWKLALTYFWDWLTLGVSITIYISLYLKVRGDPDQDPETLAMRRKSWVILA